jgi:hypothetical protein
MPRVMIKCPNTNKLVSTGFFMDKSSFDSSVLTNNSILCPACGKKHTWSKSEAVLENIK